MFVHGAARAEEAILAARAKRVIFSVGDVWWRAGWHLMGTARMVADPENSVVNGWGQCHDVKNLLIVHGSVFVNSAAVNPTPTIQALALYVRDRTKKNQSLLF